MAEALRAILASEELRSSLSRRGLERGALFSREKMMAKFGETLGVMSARAA
jgi:hypothetical protein